MGGLDVLDVPAGPEVLDAVLPRLARALDGGAPVLPVPPAPDPRRTACSPRSGRTWLRRSTTSPWCWAPAARPASPRGLCSPVRRSSLPLVARTNGSAARGSGSWPCRPGTPAGCRCSSGNRGGHAARRARPVGQLRGGCLRAATRDGRARADAEGVPLYVSVVPTQLGRLSAADLAAYDGVLVGSAAAPPGVLEACAGTAYASSSPTACPRPAVAMPMTGVPIRDVDGLAASRRRPGHDRRTDVVQRLPPASRPDRGVPRRRATSHAGRRAARRRAVGAPRARGRRHRHRR